MPNYDQVLTWIVLFMTFIIAYCFLEDWTVIDPDDLDEEYRDQTKKSIKKRHSDILDDSEHSPSETSTTVDGQCNNDNDTDETVATI